MTAGRQRSMLAARVVTEGTHRAAMEGKTIIAGRHELPTGAKSPLASWSRRRLLREGILPLGFALTVARAFAREGAESPPQLQPVPAAGAVSAAGGSGAVRSSTDLTGRLTTAVRINRQGPYRFMVDTGAERTVIAESLAAHLALPRSHQVLVQGIVRREPASLVEIRELQMGTLVSSRLEAPTLPRAMLGVDGYLGLDVLDGRRVIFDFVAGTLTVTKPQGFFAALFSEADDDIRVRTLGSSGRLRATDCLIDGVHAAAFVDTGAEISVVNQALHTALQRRNPAQTVLARQVLTGVTGGSVEGVTIVLNMVCLGDLILTFARAVVADLPVFASWGLIQQPALLIGMDCLRRCERVSIDYRRKELRFKIARAVTPPPLRARALDQRA
jgi:predicted aspartyl protease